jgi:hypothetical protein
MLRESDATFSAAQVLTATAASTNYVDRKALGDGTDGNFIVVTCPVILDSAGDAAVLTIAIESDSDSGFATALVQNLTLVLAESVLTAGIIAKIPVPLGLKQFVRLYYAVGTENFTTGTISAFVTNGVDNDNV